MTPLSANVYAYAPQHAPISGEVIFDPATGLWPAASSPALEVVLFTLRTPRGQALAAPHIGVDWQSINKVSANAAALTEQVITAGLQLYVSQGLIADLKVRAEVSADGGAIRYAVTFRDVRLARLIGPISGVV